MKYTIDGKSAYLAAKDKGIPIHTFFSRIYRGWSVEDAIKKRPVYQQKYIIKKGGRYVATCHSAQQVANYLGTSKGTICGLFRHGNKIKLFGYTCTRINKGGKNETTESI